MPSQGLILTFTVHISLDFWQQAALLRPIVYLELGFNYSVIRPPLLTLLIFSFFFYPSSCSLGMYITLPSTLPLAYKVKFGFRFDGSCRCSEYSGALDIYFNSGLITWLTAVQCSGAGSYLLPTSLLINDKWTLSFTFTSIFHHLAPGPTMAIISTPITQLFGIKHPILLAGYASLLLMICLHHVSLLCWLLGWMLLLDLN